MSMQRKWSVLLIKDKQTIIISCLEKVEKGTNLALEFKISKIYAKKSDLRYTQKQREHPEIYRQH